MSLNKDDGNKIGYKADIAWYKERIAKLQSGFVNPSILADKQPNADSYIAVLGDLYKKADKLDKRIDFECALLKIPVNRDTEPEVAIAVNAIDPESGGEYISYRLYKELMEQAEAGRSKLSIDDLITNSSQDPVSNSQLMQSRMYSAYTTQTTETAPGDNSAERYINRYLNNLVSWNEHDYQVRQILNFADNYLGMFPDPAFIPWNMKKEMVFEKTHIGSFQELWGDFSGIVTKETGRFGGALDKLTKLKPDERIADPTDRYIDYTNQFINDLHDILNETWAPALICCFVSYATRLNMKTLKGVRAMLQLLKMGFNFEFNDIINSLIDIVNNIMRGLLLNQLMGLITQIYQRLVDPIRKWINNPEDPNWQKVFDCLPVRQLIEKYIAEAGDYIYNFFQELLTEKYKEIEIEHIYKEAKTKQLKENKWITRAIKILDTVIASIELSAFCGINGTPTGEDVQRIMTQYNVGNDTSETYAYPREESPNIYNSFITKEQQAAIESGDLSKDTAMMTSSTNQLASVSSNQAIESGSKVTECLKNIKSEDMPQAIAWIDEIVKKSQEIA